MKVYILIETEKGTCPAASRNVRATFDEKEAIAWEAAISNRGYWNSYDEFDISNPIHWPKFAIFRNIKSGGKFISTNDPMKDQTLCAEFPGEKVYEIIGYGETVEECQIKLYGKAWWTKQTFVE